MFVDDLCPPEKSLIPLTALCVLSRDDSLFSLRILLLILLSSFALVVHFQKDIAEPTALLELIDRLTVHILSPAAEV